MQELSKVRLQKRLVLPQLGSPGEPWVIGGRSVGSTSIGRPTRMDALYSARPV